MKRSTLGLFIALASITIAEFTTGSTSLTEMVTNPASFFLFSLPANLGLYGCGVILIREAAIRWSKGWPTILMLGVAYGIMEEGVSVHTFFSPVTQTVGIFGQYGKYYSLNFTWAILISIFHATYSIALPILLGNLVWPETKSRRLLTRKSGTAVFALYVLTVIILFTIAPYKPSAEWLIVLLMASMLLLYGAKHLRVQFFRRVRSYKGSGTRIYLLGGLFLFPFLIVFPRYVTALPSLVTDAIIALLTLLLYRAFENRLPGNENRKLAVMAVGLLAPLQIFGFVLNLSSNPLQALAVLAIVYFEYKILKNTGGNPDLGSLPGQQSM